MRKTLIAAIVASALFAVGAFAAEFTVQSEDVASGSAVVGACADDVQISYTTSTVVAASGDFAVVGAVVRFTNDALNEAEEPITVPATDCEGADVDMALRTADVTENRWFNAASCTSPLPSGAGVTSTCTFTPAAEQPPAQGVVEARVMANGDVIEGF